jgi:hypothetical protein
MGERGLTGVDGWTPRPTTPTTWRLVGVVAVASLALVTFDGHRLTILEEPPNFAARLEGRNGLGTLGVALRVALRRSGYHPVTLTPGCRNSGVVWLRSGCDRQRPCLDHSYAGRALLVIGRFALMSDPYATAPRPGHGWISPTPFDEMSDWALSNEPADIPLFSWQNSYAIPSKRVTMGRWSKQRRRRRASP